MSDELKDGGPAFPHSAPSVPEGHYYYGPSDSGGMSLLDYFAGQSQQGYRADPAWESDSRELAKLSFADAKAMLEERNKHSGSKAGEADSKTE